MSVVENFVRTGRRAGSRVCVVGAAILLTFGSSAYAEDEIIGAEEYRVSCLACHGVGGKGDGPMAEYLTVQPSDLTQIAKDNEVTRKMKAQAQKLINEVDQLAHYIYICIYICIYIVDSE